MQCTGGWGPTSDRFVFATDPPLTPNETPSLEAVIPQVGGSLGLICPGSHQDYRSNQGWGEQYVWIHIKVPGAQYDPEIASVPVGSTVGITMRVWCRRGSLSAQNLPTTIPVCNCGQHHGRIVERGADGRHRPSGPPKTPNTTKGRQTLPPQPLLRLACQG